MGYEIDFLPVGKESRSGDAILLRYGNLGGGRDEQTVVLIDGGFRDTADSILTHLNKYYGTLTIDLVISTHPDADHINGLREIFDRIGKEHIAVRELWMHRPSRWRATILKRHPKCRRDGLRCGCGESSRCCRRSRERSFEVQCSDSRTVCRVDTQFRQSQYRRPYGTVLPFFVRR